MVLCNRFGSGKCGLHVCLLVVVEFFNEDLSLLQLKYP